MSTLAHTRAILPLMRAVTNRPWFAVGSAPIEVKVRRSRRNYGGDTFTIYSVVLTEWERDGHGVRRGTWPVRESILARWAPMTGQLYVDDADRIADGTAHREVARASKAALDALAAYALAHGNVADVHSEIPQVVRPHHYRITRD